jgi:hypothetical protein
MRLCNARSITEPSGCSSGAWDRCAIRPCVFPRRDVLCIFIVRSCMRATNVSYLLMKICMQFAFSSNVWACIQRVCMNRVYTRVMRAWHRYTIIDWRLKLCQRIQVRLHRSSHVLKCWQCMCSCIHCIIHITLYIFTVCPAYSVLC